MAWTPCPTPLNRLLVTHCVVHVSQQPGFFPSEYSHPDAPDTLLHACQPTAWILTSRMPSAGCSRHTLVQLSAYSLGFPYQNSISWVCATHHAESVSQQAGFSLSEDHQLGDCNTPCSVYLAYSLNVHCQNTLSRMLLAHCAVSVSRQLGFHLSFTTQNTPPSWVLATDCVVIVSAVHTATGSNTHSTGQRSTAPTRIATGCTQRCATQCSTHTSLPDRTQHACTTLCSAYCRMQRTQRCAAHMSRQHIQHSTVHASQCNRK